MSIFLNYKSERLNVKLAGEGEAEGGVDLADCAEHWEEVGVGVGKDGKVEFCLSFFVVVFDVERGEMHVEVVEGLAICGDVMENAVNSHAYHLRLLAKLASFLILLEGHERQKD